MKLSRRQALKASAGFATAAAGATLGLYPRTARAFGEFPTAVEGSALPANLRVSRVLEIFLYGGLSPWETFYYVDAFGAPGSANPGTQFHTFPGATAAALTACGLDDGSDTGLYFADDDNQVPVELGPFLRPLRARTDIVDRMRVLVHAHNLEPHEGAIPYALTGRRLGAPTLAGLGAHIARFSNQTAPVGRTAPFSYVFTTGGLSSDNVQAALATGAHPGSARPLAINIRDADRLTELLGRPGMSFPGSHDALLDVFGQAYGDRLRHPDEIERLRSDSFDELLVATRSVTGAPELATLFPPALLQAAPDTVCGDFNVINPPSNSLRLAQRLLYDPVQPATYVCVVDTGILEASGGGGYDTHTNHAHDCARNLLNLQNQLLPLIREGAEDPTGKIDLDDTLIIINTEFGRTPGPQGASGRNHYPYGYTTALIGGPVQRGIVGAIDEAGVATSVANVAEARIAALLAMGIFPFSQEAFGVSDVLGAGTEEGALEDVTQRVLGVTL